MKRRGEPTLTEEQDVYTTELSQLTFFLSVTHMNTRVSCSERRLLHYKLSIDSTTPTVVCLYAMSRSRDNRSHHHHHVAQPAQISLNLSHHPSLLSVAPGRPSEIYPVSAHSCCIYVLAVRSAFARPCEGIHRSMSLISSSLLLQQCPACLVHLSFRDG